MNSESARKIAKIEENIARVFLGKRESVRLVLVGLLARGHVLIEDVPGVGKTLLARALARSIGGSFKRIQFTSDLLPSDILGVSIYDAKREAFLFKPGPIFANVVLADEINRTPPRTQSSLLEAMNEFQVSVDGQTHPLPSPFVVLATQNPYETAGTYPLPESQLDRFFIRVKIGYPSLDDERRILTEHVTLRAVEELSPVVSPEEVVALQDEIHIVRVDDALKDYALAIARRTRESERLRIGVSPRGTLALLDGAKALALIEGREFCVPDDIKSLAKPILLHRLLCRSAPRPRIPLEGGESTDPCEEALEEILESVRVPL